MFPCPHCGNKIDVAPPVKVSWWQFDTGGTPVSLGCGTLILIAIIVAIFSGGGESSEIRALQRDVQSLEQKIDNLAAQAATSQPIEEAKSD